MIFGYFDRTSGTFEANMNLRVECFDLRIRTKICELNNYEPIESVGVSKTFEGNLWIKVNNNPRELIVKFIYDDNVNDNL